MRSYTYSHILWLFWLTSILALIKLGISNSTYPEDDNFLESRLFVGQRCVTRAGKPGFCQKAVVLKNPAVACGIRPPSNNFRFFGLNDMKPLNKNNRIVGGIEAQPNSWPWAVVIYQITYSNDLSAPKTKFICGGTIISEKYILTAAHCIVRQTEVLGPRNFKIQFGAHDLKKSGFFSEISEIKVHEKYTISQHRNDIALMKLAVPLDFDSLQNVRPVCLPTLEMEKYNLVGTMSYLVGWGTTSQGGRANHVLHEVQIPISDVKDCAKKYSLLLSASDQVSDNQMCASYPEGGKDTCQGDSGGSLTVPVDGVYYEMGIVSFGKGCAQAGYPGVYTKVSSFLYWIGTHMEP